MRINKIERITLMGGLIGQLLTNPRAALEKSVTHANADGWYCRQVMPHAQTNLFMILLSWICLICTFGLWTFGGGYLLLLEKDRKD